MGSRREQLMQQIEGAFTDTPYPGDERIAYSPNTWECEELNTDFRGMSWKDVPREVLRRHSQDLALFSTEGFRYYLPTYLLAALDDFWDVREFVLSHLTLPEAPTGEPEQRSFALRRFEHLSPAQKRAVRACLEYFRDEAPGEVFRAHVLAALERYWGTD
jgi:hypothetical protein